MKQSLTRNLFRLARTLTPVLSWGDTVLVFRDQHVREILARDQDFTLAEINGENISRHIGPFILGMDDGPEYQRNVGILRRAVKKEDLERLRTFIRKEAREIASQLSGEFDVVEGFTREIPYRLLDFYFGVPGPDRTTMLKWNRTIFWDAFLDLKNDPQVREAALASSAEMMPYLLGLIADRKSRLSAGEELRDNMLHRLIHQQIQEDAPFYSDREMAGHIAGTFMGLVEPTSKACVNVLRQFWARPKIWEEALAAARADDVQQMSGLAFEALRFHPTMPLLIRYAGTAQTLHSGPKPKTVRGSKKVFAITHSAMFDPRVVEQPGKFDPQRQEVTRYYFGHGLHNCFGNYINDISIPEMLIALLQVDGLRPVRRKGSKVSYEGPFPSSWLFTSGP